jgi:DNA-binding NtrC family response regulator
MPYRLVARLGDRTLPLALREGTNLLGSRDDCGLRLDHPTVSRAHAELVVDGERVRLRDLDSRNGTFVDGQRVAQAEVGPGATLAFGQVPSRLEYVPADDVATAVRLPAAPPLEDDVTPDLSTVRSKPVETFALEQLPALIALLGEGASPERVAQAGGAALFQTLPLAAVEVAFSGAPEVNSGAPPLARSLRDRVAASEAVWFRAERPVGAAEPVEVAAGADVIVRAWFPRAAQAGPFQPLLEAVAGLIQAAGRGPSPPAAAAAPAAPRLPEPATVAPLVRQAYTDAARVARGDVGVLIGGESGTGKEVLARYVHAASRRASRPFVALNCAALPRDLLEAELFGIEKGVATGVEARAGKFELAHGGTLFLDEIGDMSLETQAKLLRVLQERTVHRLGGVGARPADVRIVAATNRNMRALRADGLFREDLYFRIATWSVELPPLRARRPDIANLAVHFLAREAERAGVRVAGISRAALSRLTAYDWPGNVRQLENEMARCVLFLSDGELLDSGRLAPELRQAEPAARPGRLEEVLASVEREEIRKALDACGGDVGRAAELLGLGRSTLYRRLRSLGLLS